MGSTNAAGMDTACAGPQGQAAPVPTAEMAMAVAADEGYWKEGSSCPATPHVVLSSVAMAMLKGDSFRLVTCYGVVYQQLEAVAWSRPNLEQAAYLFPGVIYFATLGLSQGLQQTSTDEEGEEV